MNSTASSYQPLGFLSRLGRNRHVVMLYDDEKQADLFIVRYFAGGLAKGESCVFLTEVEPTPIRQRLAVLGIDVGEFEAGNHFRFFQTPRTAAGKVDALDVQRALVAESTKGMRGPFRFVGRTISDTESIEGMSQGMKFEKVGNDHFEEFGIGLLCFYDVRRIEQSRRGRWIRGLLENHQSVIYASDPRRSVAFETSLLEMR